MFQTGTCLIQGLSHAPDKSVALLATDELTASNITHIG